MTPKPYVPERRPRAASSDRGGAERVDLLAERGDRERLAQERICAALEVRRFRLGRDQEHRERAGPRRRPQSPGDLEPVESGHPHVEDHHAGRVPRDELESLRAVRPRDHAIARIAQGPRDDVAHERVVVGEDHGRT
jgi:hypothetical protein